MLTQRAFGKYISHSFYSSDLAIDWTISKHGDVPSGFKNFLGMQNWPLIVKEMNIDTSVFHHWKQIDCCNMLDCNDFPWTTHDFAAEWDDKQIVVSYGYFNIVPVLFQNQHFGPV